MEPTVGLRVVRGPDWSWGDQDGGEGGVGTVVFVGTLEEYRNSRSPHPPRYKRRSSHRSNAYGSVVIQWDIGGQRRAYKSGDDGLFDLRVLDSSPTDVRPDYRCSACRERISKAEMLCMAANKTQQQIKQECGKEAKEAYHSKKLRPKTKEDEETNDDEVDSYPQNHHKQPNSGSSSEDYAKEKKPNVVPRTEDLSARYDAVAHLDGRLPTTKPLGGILWSCLHCKDYYLCSACYHSDRHSTVHRFMRIEGSKRTLLPPRLWSVKVEARGIFRGATVFRGRDWEWGDQDGGAGQTGTVKEICRWSDDSYESVALVEWYRSKQENVYRVGLNGRVDLQCHAFQEAASGGWYYPSHLPVLGDEPNVMNESIIVAGDRVVMDTNIDFMQELQNGHGGFTDTMASFIGHIGLVNSVTSSGDIIVTYSSFNINPAIATEFIGHIGLVNSVTSFNDIIIYSGDVRFNVNPAITMKVDIPLFRQGDMVKMLEDREEVKRLQEGNGGWVEDMRMFLGAEGRVVRVLETGNIVVRFKRYGKRWNLHPQCVTEFHPEDGSVSDSSVGSFTPRSSLRWGHGFGMQSLHPEILVSAAATGDIVAVRDYLQARPGDVNKTHLGKTALHAAVMEAHIDVVKELLESHNSRFIDVNMQDTENQETPLHLCAHHNHSDIAKLLLDKGADVNIPNALGMPPLTIATATGSYKVLKLFTEMPQVNLDAKDFMISGNTALHLAVLTRRREAIAILINAGADPFVTNVDHFSPISEAAKSGFFSGLELFLEYFPESINRSRPNDGHTPLHIAAANDYLDALCYLASMDSCDLDATNILAQTALYTAAETGHPRIIERLVAYGADVNIADNNGHTLLHLITVRKEMGELSQWTPELNEFYIELLSISGMENIPSYLVVICFLIREGADPQKMSSVRARPLDLALPHEATLMRKMTSRRSQSSFRKSVHRKTHLPPLIPEHRQQQEWGSSHRHTTADAAFDVLAEHGVQLPGSSGAHNLQIPRDEDRYLGELPKPKRKIK